MRIALVLVIVLAGCAKKAAPAKSPATQTLENKGSATGTPGGASDDADEKAGGETKGDPCDGGETKKK
jgi:hypothetical protein